MHSDFAVVIKSAEKTGRQALGIAESELSPDDPELAQVLNALGMICKYLAYYDEGLSHYQRALKILDGSEDPEEVRPAC